MKYDVDNFVVKESKDLLNRIETKGNFSINEVVECLSNLINDNTVDKHKIIDLQKTLGKSQQKRN